MNPEIIKVIQSNTCFLAHAHIGPDVDSLGSILALKLGLEQIGKTVNLFCEDKIPPFADFLPGINSVENLNLENALTLSPDVYVSLDTAKWELASYSRPVPRINLPTINIDHHPDNNIKTPLSWVDGSQSSASAMVYKLLKKLSINITSDIATCLLAGVLADTNVLRNTNTDTKTLKIAAQLTALGGDYHTCVFHLKKSIPSEQLKLWARLLDKIQLSPSKDFVWVTLTNNQCRELKAKDLGSFVNVFLSSVKDTKFGALLAEKSPGITKGYLRAREKIDISLIAHKLNGGGHQAAAGFRLEKEAVTAEKEFLAVVHSLQEQNKL